jgi:hypothetical protein
MLTAANALGAFLGSRNRPSKAMNRYDPGTPSEQKPRIVVPCDPEFLLAVLAGRLLPDYRRTGCEIVAAA